MGASGSKRSSIPGIRRFGSSGSASGAAGGQTALAAQEALDAEQAFASRQTAQVAVIGAGYLGARIAAELLLLGVEVDVFERGLAALGRADGQKALELKVFEPILECKQQGLLDKADMRSPSWEAIRGYTWEPVAGRGPVAPRWCGSLEEAVKGKPIVIESVPDMFDLKCSVFSECAVHALPGVLLATSTVTLPLGQLQEGVTAKLTADGAFTRGTQMPKVVGLRFLSPVVFVPFVEVTLTAEQSMGQDREDLMALLTRWGKGSFVCDVQGAADGGEAAYATNIKLGMNRLRLDAKLAFTQQEGEAVLRKAHRQGPEAVAALTSRSMFGFRNGEERCCICLTDPPAITSLLCGHKALCGPCAELVEIGSRKCPLCRADFKRQLEAPSAAQTITNGDAAAQSLSI